jgi:hypothetical protein
VVIPVALELMDESLMLRHFGLDAPSFVLGNLALDADGLFAAAAAPVL